MKPVAAIVEPAFDVELSFSKISVSLAGERDAENSAKRHEQLGAAARETAAMRRREVGLELLRVRGAWPKHGPGSSGWTDFLKRLKLDDSTALRYMEQARTSPVHGQPGNATQKPSVSGIGDRDVKPDNTAHTTPPTVTEAEVLALLDRLDQDARGRVMRSLRSKQGRENEGDRDAYCTPPKITAALPEVDFDPCSNPRSTVRARRSIQLERGENGLEVAWKGSGFWNIPYSKPLPWAEKFERERAAITMAGWLVNEDHSPQWWHLITQTLPLRLDFDDRLEFVPPPGVPTSKNDRPQTLLMDVPFWAGCDQAALLAMGKLWVRADHAQEFARTTTALRIVR